MIYRLNKSRLLEILRQWNQFLNRKVHLIACGGTAMTLMGVKPSTKMEFSNLYIGILNHYDLITSKLMRGTRVDYEDCLSLAEAHWEAINIERLIRHFHELVSYDVAQDRLRPNIDTYLALLRDKGLYE